MGSSSDLHEVELVVPIQTVSEANRREHWAKKSKRAKEQRSHCCMAVLSATSRALVDEMLIAGIEVTLTRIAPRELDDDNLRGALKAARDGVADALRLKSDRDRRVRWSYAQERGGVREYAVRIRLEVWK